MARGVNVVILIGNLGADPEMRFTPSTTAIANLRLATSESWRDKSTGEQRERTEWHKVVLYNRLAEIAGEYLRKGSKIYLRGRLQTRKWQDTAGQSHTTTEIVGDDLQMLDARGTATSTMETPHAIETATTEEERSVKEFGLENHEVFGDDVPF